MGRPGLELSPDSRQTARICDTGGTNSGNIGASLHPADHADHDLAVIVAAWPRLAPATRAAIITMISAGDI